MYTLPPETEQVIATLYYQTASQEYVDFLRTNGGLDGQTLGELWQSLKSPPEMMAQAWAPGHDAYLPLVLKGWQVNLCDFNLTNHENQGIMGL